MVVNLMIVVIVHAQDATTNQEIHALIDQYTQARETKDTALLDRILAPVVDQLVSSGTWRNDKKESMKGMLQSSQNNPGTRKITIEKVRMLNATSGIVDTKYEIENTDGSTRKMWSTFIVVYHEDRWKISAIRNMLPAG